MSSSYWYYLPASKKLFSAYYIYVCMYVLSLFCTPGSLTPPTFSVQNTKTPRNFSTFLQHGVKPGELVVKATWLGQQHKATGKENTTQDRRLWGFDKLSILVNKKWTAVQCKTGQAGWCILYNESANETAIQGRELHRYCAPFCIVLLCHLHCFFSWNDYDSNTLSNWSFFFFHSKPVATLQQWPLTEVPESDKTCTGH